MLNFLNTSVLFAAVAALIPLIIHLFSKRKVKIIEFSSVRHLKAMQKRQVRKLKIRQLLLLLLRMLIIFVAVLAFARPTTESGNIGSHASVSAVVLFDNSISMDRYVADGNLFEIAKKRTKQLLDNFTESDEVMFLPLASSDKTDFENRFTSSVAAVDELNLIQPEYKKANLQQTLQNALTDLKSASNLNKELYIITDLQRYSLPDTALLSDFDGSVYFVDLPLEENDNCGITSVDFGGQLIIPGHDFNISATVKNQGQTDRNDIIASLVIDGNRIAQIDFNVPAGEEKSVTFTRSISTTGFHSGYVEISDDKFPADNRYYFSIRIPDKFNVLIIDGDNTGELMKLALAPMQSLNRYWSVKTAKLTDLSGINFWDYDVIFLTGAPKLQQTYVQRLRSFLSQGRSLFITYDGKTDIEYFNKNYSELSGVIYDEPARLDFTRAGYYSFATLDAKHPIFSVFDYKENKPPEIKFYTLPKMHLSSKAKSLLTFTGDRPALVEHAYKTGRVITFTGPIAPYYGDLTANSFFVPFLSRIAEYLASDLSAYDLELYCGENISRTLTDRISVNDAVTMIAPDSIEYKLVPEDKSGSLVLNIDPSDLPGIYSLSYRGREIDRFALNIRPDECDLTAVDPDQFEAAIGASKMNEIKPDANIEATLAELRFGSELWQYFLWIAVILLAIEMILSRAKSGAEE